MSEADYMTFLRDRQKQGAPLPDTVQISLADETDFAHQGTLDFVDNTLNRSSGTDAIAQTYLNVLRQPRNAWTWEVELRPWVETF
jgi:hypothetical protein